MVNLIKWYDFNYLLVDVNGDVWEVVVDSVVEFVEMIEMLC